MKILIVTTAFPRWSGDTRAPFVYEAAKALQRKGNDIRVLAMHTPGAQVYENWNGIEIKRPRYLPEKYEILQREGGGLPVIWKKGGLSRLVMIPFIITHTIGSLREARKVDLVHANWTLSAGCVWLTRWIHQKPYIVTVHGSDIFQALNIPLVRKLTKIILFQADKVIAVSKALALELVHLGIKEDSIEVIPDGVNLDLFKPDDTERDDIILFVGSLTFEKGGDVLICSFREVLQKFPNYQLFLIGDGPYRNEWERLSIEVGISENIKFLGQLSQEDVAKIMRRVKLLILPSRQEGLGVVLLEAMASGTPCIGSDVGGIKDVIDNYVGILVTPNDPEILAEATIGILNSPSRLNEFSIAARKKVEREFGWNQIATRIITQYKKVME